MSNFVSLSTSGGLHKSEVDTSKLCHIGRIGTPIWEPQSLIPLINLWYSPCFLTISCFLQEATPLRECSFDISVSSVEHYSARSYTNS